MTRVLLIEDDDGLRRLLRVVLEAAQFEVVEAENGREGLARFREHPVEVVITDLVMPEQDGLGVLTALRIISPGTPIVVISGGLPRSPLYLKMAGKLGAVQVLAKPFLPSELISAVRTALGDPEPL